MNNKIIKIGGMVIGVVAVAGIIYLGSEYLNQNYKKSLVPIADSNQLIDEYKSQLSDLKKQAKKTGDSQDLQNYGIAQYATGDTAGAIETYTKQIAKDPNNVIAHSGLANALRDEKKFDEAVLEYKKAIDLAPTNVSLYANLGSVYQYSLKQMANALQVYEQGIEKNPKSTDLYMLLGLAYGQVNDKVGAKQAYERVLAISPDNLAAKGAIERLGQ